MALKIDMEREFFKAVKDIETHEEARREFLARVIRISEEWIDRKLRLGVLGLKK